jgi:hypothetical protein
VKKLLVPFLFLTVTAGCGVDTVEAPGGENPGADAAPGGGDDEGGGGDVEQDNRVTDQLQLLYKFAGVAGQTTVADVSGVGTAFDLTISDPANVSWEGGYLTFTQPDPRVVAQNPNPITKVIEACQASNTISVEVWVKNATIENQGRIVTNSVDNNTRNFAIKQVNDYYEFRLQTSQQNGTDGNTPYLAASPVGTATAVDQHIVATRNTVGVTNFYVNGVKQSPDSVPGNFGNWGLDYGISFGNEPNLDSNQWLGTIYLAAVYCKELSLAEVQQNYAEGY